MSKYACRPSAVDDKPYWHEMHIPRKGKLPQKVAEDDALDSIRKIAERVDGFLVGEDQPVRYRKKRVYHGSGG